jgi:hypothetical protein
MQRIGAIWYMARLQPNPDAPSKSEKMILMIYRSVACDQTKRIRSSAVQKAVDLQALEELSLVCLPYQCTKHLHHQEKQHRREWVTLAESTGMVDTPTGAVVHHDFGAGGSKDVRDPIAPCCRKVEVLHDLQEEWSGHGIKSLRDVDFEKQAGLPPSRDEPGRRLDEAKVIV